MGPARWRRNFGIVSRFEFALHPVSTVLGGLMLFPLARGKEVLTALREWAPGAPDEASMLAAINTAFAARTAGDTYNVVSTWTHPGEDAHHIAANRPADDTVGPGDHC